MSPRPHSSRNNAPIGFPPSPWLRSALDFICVKMQSIEWPEGDPLRGRKIGYKHAIEYSTAIMAASFKGHYAIVNIGRMRADLASQGWDKGQINAAIATLYRSWGKIYPTEAPAAAAEPLSPGAVIDAAARGAENAPDVSLAASSGAGDE